MEDDHVGITMEQDNRLELVVGTHGRGAGLWDAMQAVFSPVGPDGYPKPIWDKRTGVIDHEVADLLARSLRPQLHHAPRLDDARTEAGRQDPPDRRHGRPVVPRQRGPLRRTRFSRARRIPSYDGSVEYGDRFIHCYQGDPSQPLAISQPHGRSAADAGDGGRAC